MIARPTSELDLLKGLQSAKLNYVQLLDYKNKYKYSNTNTRIQILKYKYSNTNTQIQILKYKYSNTNTFKFK